MNSSQEFEHLRVGLRELETSNFKYAAALATITRTVGSTFRHAGTSMLVKSDGNVVCALSGGCPQRDIVARALSVIASNRPEIVRYNPDSNLDVLMEMGCGGEMEVLIEPLTRVQDVRFVDAVAKVQTLRVAGFMATAFARQGIAMSPRPQRLVSIGNAEWNDIRDAALVDLILPIGLSLSANSRATVYSFQSAHGSTDVLIEPLRPAHRLFVIGVNAASLALARVSTQLGWRTLLIDHLGPPTLETDLLPANADVVQATPDSLRNTVSLDRFSSVVVMTFNIERDIAYLGALADAPVAYLGAITSRERSERMRDAVDGIGARLHAPAGLDLGAQTPEEIALAVSAEILTVLNARSGTSLGGSGNAIRPR